MNQPEENNPQRLLMPESVLKEMGDRPRKLEEPVIGSRPDEQRRTDGLV
jgi:hypothetical protein